MIGRIWGETNLLFYRLHLRGGEGPGVVLS